MKEDQEPKCHVCRFCKQSFSNGKKLGGHMRCHLALISASRKQKDQESVNGEKGFGDIDDKDDDQIIKKKGGGKQSIQENDQEDVNGERGLDFDVMVNKSQRIIGVDQDFNRGNVYVLRENPKRSWRVSNSKEKNSSCKKRFDSRKELMKQSVCEKCGKSFNSMKALYGHMRCHSIRRSGPFDQDDDDDVDEDDEVANPVRKKRSCTRYKSPKPNHHCDSLSSCYDEVENGAICLMMLSRGVRYLDEVKMVISHQASNVEFEVSVDGSMKNKSKVGLKKDLIFESGSGQLDPGWAGSTRVEYKPLKEPRSCDQDFGDMDVADYGISLELERRSKGHNCPISLKEFGSGRALGCHKRVHDNIIGDAHGFVNPDVEFLREVSTMVLWGP